MFLRILTSVFVLSCSYFNVCGWSQTQARWNRKRSKNLNKKDSYISILEVKPITEQSQLPFGSSYRIVVEQIQNAVAEPKHRFTNFSLVRQEQNIRMQQVEFIRSTKSESFFFCVRLIIILRRKIFLLFSVCHFFDFLITKFQHF